MADHNVATCEKPRSPDSAIVVEPSIPSAARFEEIDSNSAGLANTTAVQSSTDVAGQVRSLSRVNGLESALAIAFDWSIIVSCFACALYFQEVWVWCLAAMVIAARQHALLILMHDGSHYRLFRNRTVNDRTSNWLLAWPLLVSTEGYRQNHFAHHSYLNTDADPDWNRKVGRPEWTFPKSRLGVAWLLLKELCGGGFIEALKAITRLSGGSGPRPETRMLRFERIAFYMAIAGAVIAAGLWKVVLLLWFGPAFTLLPVLLRVRSIAEHFGVEGDHEFNMSRNTHCSVWERFLLAPHHSAYHLDHHLYPSVPFYNLPRLHELLLSIEEYRARSHQTVHFFGISRETMLSELSRGV